MSIKACRITVTSMCLAAMLFLVFVSEAKADHYYPDSDGRIPLKWECNKNTDWLGWTSGKVIVKTGEVKRKIHINWCRIYEHGYGWNGILYVYRHEMAHAKGWEHWELPRHKNAAYYPYYPRHGGG